MRPLALALLLLLLLPACTPIAGFRPASGLLPDKRLEIGGGGAVIGPRPYVEEPARGAGQVWATGRTSRRVTLSAIGAFDDSAVALGGAVRLDYLRTGRVAAGVEVEGGFAWAGASVPAALRLFDETWLYTAPRLGTRGLEWAIELPVGLSVRIFDGWMVRAEYRVSWVELDPFTRRHLVGFATAYQF
jgi:hypothetical protein